MSSAAGESKAAPSVPCPVCDLGDTKPLFWKRGYRFVRCAGCGLVRVDPLPSATELAETYERSYRDGAYADFARADDVRLATARARLAAVVAHAPAGPWLDIGCSTGAFLRVAADAGLDAEGIELSETAAAAARRAGLAVTRSAIEDFEPARRFAVVAAFDLLEHLRDPGVLLRRVRPWLLPAGCLVVTVPDVASLPARLMRRHWYFYAPPLHLHYFDRRTIVRLLRRHGFAPVLLGPAPKLLTVDAALDALAPLNPRLHRIARLLAAPLPGGFRRRLWRIPVGELLVVASTHGRAA
jgi:SAM-dependent methyltransferase